MRKGNNTISSNLAHFRPRKHPTNTHTNIFGWEQTKINLNATVRCTPTFHSQIFNNKFTPEEQKYSNGFNTTVVYHNKTKDARQASLNHGSIKNSQYGKGIKEFYDKQKLNKINQLHLNLSYAKQRKNLQLSSNSIYDLSGKQPVNKNKLGYDTYLPTCPFK